MGGGSNTNIPESPEEVAQANVAKSQWTDYQKRWVPVQEYFINRTQGGQAAKQNLAEGSANVDVQGRFGNAVQQLSTAYRNRGVMAGSGRDIAGQAGLASDKGLTGGMVQSGTAAAAQRQYEQGLSQIIGMGRGTREAADTSLGTLAGLGGQEATAGAEASAQEQAGLGQAIGTGVGLGGSYLMPNKFGQQQQPAPQAVQPTQTTAPASPNFQVPFDSPVPTQDNFIPQGYQAGGLGQ